MLIQIPAMMEIALVMPSGRGGQFPGLFLYTSPARMMRPVRYLPTGDTEWIGTFEQVCVYALLRLLAFALYAGALCAFCAYVFTHAVLSFAFDPNAPCFLLTRTAVHGHCVHRRGSAAAHDSPRNQTHSYVLFFLIVNLSILNIRHYLISPYAYMLAFTHERISFSSYSSALM